jgi:hypothetical protein
VTTAFKIGDVCIWQNCVGPWTYLNGTETTITSGQRFGIDTYSMEFGVGFGTDTPDPARDGYFLIGPPHELRLKHPPKSDEATARQAMLDFIERARLPVAADA